MKKIPGLLAVMAVIGSCNGVISGRNGVMALGSSEGAVNRVVANQIEDAGLVFMEISAQQKIIKYRFDGESRNLGLKQLVFASYKENEYSQVMVEQDLAKLIGWPYPVWAQNVDSFYPNISSNYQWERRAGVSSEEILNNAPSILYYAALIQDKTDRSEHWVRGKLDYRKCAYLDAEGGQNVANCKVEMNEGKYVFARQDGKTGEELTEWGEEMSARLWGDLNDLSANVRAWEGDAEAKAEIEAELKKIEDLAVDAKDSKEILQKVKEYRGTMATVELKKEVAGLIDTFEQGVADWAGDEEGKGNLLTQATRIEEKAARLEGEDKDKLLARFTVCKDELTTKIQTYEKQQENKPSTGGDSTGGDGGTDGDGGNKTEPGASSTGGGNGGTGGNGSISGIGSVSGGEPDKGTEEPGVTTGKEVNETNTETDRTEAGREDNQELATKDKLAVKDNAQERLEKQKNDENGENQVKNGVENELKNDQRSVSEAEVPVLSEGKLETEGKNGVIWWVLGVILLAIGAGIWWVKRAFFGKTRVD